MFIIIDDGGHPCTSTGEVITFDAYENVLRLAKEFKLRVPICFTMRYLDINNVSGCGQLLSYARELIDLLRANEEYIEIGYHGLTHGIDSHDGEFYLLDIHMPVPEEIQREHIHKSCLIYKDLGWDFPELFVPPKHAWELGTTDKILANYGVEYLISHRKMKYKGHTYKWGNSQYLTFLPRGDLGIWDYDTHLSIDKLEAVKRWILPRSVMNIPLLPKIFSKPVHSYMTHIGNFMNPSYEFWREFFQYCRGRYYLPTSNEDVVNKCFSITKGL